MQTTFETDGMEVRLEQSDSGRLRDRVQREYAEILTENGIVVSAVSAFVYVGRPLRNYGWILHLCTTCNRINELMRLVIPVLLSDDIPFKLPTTHNFASMLLDVDFGHEQMNKLVTIYAGEDDIVLRVAKKLLKLTNGFNGPSIPTDIRLGGIVHTRFGAYLPVHVPMEDGSYAQYYSGHGGLIKDEYFIPYKQPHDISWPFSDIRIPAIEKEPKILKDRFLIKKTLKADIKGSVYKCLYTKNGIIPKWAVVKEGKAGMWSDILGRDITDRIEWQNKLQRELSGIINLPSVLDYFTHGTSTYLVMEFIEGVKLTEAIFSIQRGCVWFALSNERKMGLMSYLQQVIEMVSSMHKAGYVHRDLNTDNFITTRTGKLYMYDLELAYSYSEKMPYPPFTLGTPGFMSPEQQGQQVPTIKEDIYAMGAMLFVFISGLHPLKLAGLDQDEVYQRAYTFSQDEILAGIISGCISADPAVRPELSEIAEWVTEKSMQARTGDVSDRNYFRNTSLGIQLIEKCIKSYSVKLMEDANQIWVSKVKQERYLVGNENKSRVAYPELANGVAGSIYLLSVMLKKGISIAYLSNQLQANMAFINGYLNSSTNLKPGLYHQCSGIVMAISEAISAGLMNTDDARYLVDRYTSQLPTELDVENGIAGHGLALLAASRNIPGINRRSIDGCAEYIVKNQNKSGGWGLKNPVDGRNAEVLGFSNGAAGMLYFLLEYYHLYGKEHVEKCIRKGLKRLISLKFEYKGMVKWPVEAGKSGDYPWLQNGYLGIILTLIKAFERLKDSTYRQHAEKALLGLEEFISNSDLSLQDGLTGAGEVYLEAYRVFKDKKYLDRAEWIKKVLENTYSPGPENSIYWITDNSTVPTTGLHDGNSGILYFLLRFQHPDLKFYLSL